MRKRPLLVAAAALSLSAFGTMNYFDSTAAQAPGPSAGEVIAEDISTTGTALGPDGAIYAAMGGEAGTEEFESEFGPLLLGETGSIARIDPETGEWEVVVDGLPTVAFDETGGSGPVDVAFIGDDMYVLMATGGAAMGLEDNPIGIYLVEDDGDLVLVADIGTFNDDDPAGFPDNTPGGNPFSFTPYGDDAFIVTDGNFNRVMLAELDGDVSIIVQLDNVVPTGTETDGEDAWYTEFGSEGSGPTKGKVFSLDVAGEDATQIGTGYANIIDVELCPDGRLYALSMGDAATDHNGPPAVPFTGKILHVNANGTLTPVVSGLMLATSLEIDDDEVAYVAGLAGFFYRIEDFCDLHSPPLTPSPTSTTVVPSVTSTVPTSTVTTVPSSTATAVPATATATRTATTVPPTATSTATMVPPTATNTSVPPTATATVRVPMPPNTGSGTDGNGSSTWLFVAASGALIALGAGAYATGIRRKS